MIVLPKKKNWAKSGVLVALFVGLLGIAITIISSDWDTTDKYFGIIIIALLGYIVYNELTK